MGNQNKTKIPLTSSWFEEFSNTPCSVNTFFISFLKNSIQRARSGSNSSLLESVGLKLIKVTVITSCEYLTNINISHLISLRIILNYVKQFTKYVPSVS